MKFLARLRFRSFKHLEIKSKLALLVGVFLLGFIVLGGFAYQTLNLLEVNGPIYMRIVHGQNLLIDTTPPSMYIIEAYLLVM
jgi:hypothetical protein